MLDIQNLVDIMVALTGIYHTNQPYARVGARFLRKGDHVAEEGKRLRSARSCGPKTKGGFIHRRWMKSEVGASGTFGERELH
jgi:hypothetical protein